jgi:hypothetical protein
LKAEVSKCEDEKVWQSKRYQQDTTPLDRARENPFPEKEARIEGGERCQKSEEGQFHNRP